MRSRYLSTVAPQPRPHSTSAKAARPPAARRQRRSSTWQTPSCASAAPLDHGRGPTASRSSSGDAASRSISSKDQAIVGRLFI